MYSIECHVRNIAVSANQLYLFWNGIHFIEYNIKYFASIFNKMPAKAFTPPAETKMGTRPGRVVTREFIGDGVYSLISVLPN